MAIRLLCLESVETLSSGILFVQSLVPEISLKDICISVC